MEAPSFPALQEAGAIKYEKWAVAPTVPTKSSYHSGQFPSTVMFRLQKQEGCLPILKVMGMPNAAELSQAIGLSFVNPISATVGLGAMGLEPAAMFFAACFAAPIVIFFGAFLSSMYSTKVPVKFSHVVLVWFERAILVTVFLSLVCKIMF